jgi:hypothetical protein
MKSVKTNGVVGAAAIALILFATACSKKSSNSGPALGTMTMWVNDTTVTLTATVDTLQQVNITGVGVLPGSTDTVTLQIVLNNFFAGLSSIQLAGMWIDTAVYGPSSDGFYTDPGTSSYYTQGGDGPGPGTNVFEVDVTSDNNYLLNGTFSGVLYQNNGVVNDSIIIKNGKFSVQVQ